MPLSNSLIQKTQPNTSFTDVATIITNGYKQECETGFDGVRITVYHQSNTLTNYSILVAATETCLGDGTETNAERSQPIDGGSVHDTIDDAGGKGWFTPTADVTALGNGSDTVSEKLPTSIIPITSIPRADGGTRRAVIIRVAATNGDTQNTRKTNTDPSMRVPNSDNAGRIYQTMSKPGDTTKLADVAEFMQFDQNAILISVEFITTTPGLTFLANGDSITSGRNQIADKVTNWGFVGCANASTPENPVHYVNQGQPATSPSIYQPNSISDAASLSPAVQYYSTLSPNAYDSPSEAEMITALADMDTLLDGILEDAYANNRIPVTSTGIPNSNELDATTDALMIEYNDTLLARAKAKSIYVMDFRKVLTDGGSPATIKAQYAWNGETPAGKTHPNELAHHTVMADECTRIINLIRQDLNMVTTVQSYFPMTGSTAGGLTDERSGFSTGPMTGVYPATPFDTPGVFRNNDASNPGSDVWAVRLDAAQSLPDDKTFYDNFFRFDNLKAQATGSTVAIIVGLFTIDGTEPSSSETLFTWGQQIAGKDAIAVDISGGGAIRALTYHSAADASTSIAGDWGNQQRIAFVLEMTDTTDTMYLYTKAAGIESPNTDTLDGNYFSVPTDADTGLTFFGIGRTAADPIPEITRLGGRNVRDINSADFGFIKAVGDDVDDTLWKGWISDYFANGGYPIATGEESPTVRKLYRHSMPLTGRGMGGKHNSPLIKVRK